MFYRIRALSPFLILSLNEGWGVHRIRESSAKDKEKKSCNLPLYSPFRVNKNAEYD